MAIPAKAKKFDASFDPYELLDYTSDLTGTDPLLEGAEIATSFSLALGAEAAALGVEISNAVGREASLVNASKAVRFWLQVAVGFRENAAFDGEGVLVPITLSIETNNTPSRRRQRTLVIQVQQL